MRIKWPATGSILCVGPGALESAVEHARKILSDSEVRSAALFDCHTHPDFQMIQPDTHSQWIKIDQIRELIVWANGKPQIADKKIAIVSPAHLLNLAAANALLKTLEEPSLETLIILVTDKPAFIPATIRSRCYWIRFRAIQVKTIDSALMHKMQQDLQAIQSHKIDPVSVGMDWCKADPKNVVDILLEILHQQMITDVLQAVVYKENAWWNFIDAVYSAKASLMEANAPNVQLVFESLLIQYGSFSNKFKTI